MAQSVSPQAFARLRHSCTAVRPQPTARAIWRERVTLPRKYSRKIVLDFDIASLFCATDLPPSDLTQKDERVAVIEACVEVPRGVDYGEIPGMTVSIPAGSESVRHHTGMLAAMVPEC